LELSICLNDFRIMMVASGADIPFANNWRGRITKPEGFSHVIVREPDSLGQATSAARMAAFANHM
jgi:hypothetical protein